MDYSRPARWAIAIALLTLTGAAGASTVPGELFTSETCPGNCVMTLRSASSLLVVAKDTQGAVFTTHSFQLPRDAVPVPAARHNQSALSGSRGRMSGVASTSSSDGSCLTMPGLCTETSVRTYSTPTHYIFYTYTYVYNDGNLIHIDVEETRVLRNQVK